jgi:hypothetical protein
LSGDINRKIMLKPTTFCHWNLVPFRINNSVCKQGLTTNLYPCRLITIRWRSANLLASLYWFCSSFSTLLS